MAIHTVKIELNNVINSEFDVRQYYSEWELKENIQLAVALFFDNLSYMLPIFEKIADDIITDYVYGKNDYYETIKKYFPNFELKDTVLVKQYSNYWTQWQTQNFPETLEN